MITTHLEHKSILKTCDFLADKIGCTIEYVKTDKDGTVDIDDLERLCQKLSTYSPFLVSIQFANNEIGTIQDVKSIGKIVHQYGGVFHTDAVQAFPEKEINVNKLGIDMMSVSGHKFGAPKGIGFLYKRGSVGIEPLIHGGKQEYGLRGGTENTPYIAGLCEAIRYIDYDKVKDIRHKRDLLLGELAEIDGAVINGAMGDNRLANNISISFRNVSAESLILLMDMEDINIASGSACNGQSDEISHVLRSIGLDDSYAYGTIRITIGDDFQYGDIHNVAEKIKKNVDFLQVSN